MSRIEKNYKQMMKEEAPDLWDKIESQLEERTVYVQQLSFIDKCKNVLANMKPMKMAVITACFVVVIAGAGSQLHQMNGSFQYNTKSAAMEMATNSGVSGAGMMDVAEAEEGYSASTSEMDVQTKAMKVTNSRKLIKHMNIDVETLEFDAFLNDIKVKTEQLGGYVEYTDIKSHAMAITEGRYANLTLRIPCENSKDLLQMVEGQTNILHQSESVEDVTLAYVDLESHMEALEVEQKQLLELLEKAASLQETLDIQSRLTDIRYEMESYGSQLKTYDNLIDYDTVNLYVKEVSKTTPTEEMSIFDRIKTGFTASLIGVKECVISGIVWVISRVPYFVVGVAILFVFFKVLKKIIRLKK